MKRNLGLALIAGSTLMFSCKKEVDGNNGNNVFYRVVASNPQTNAGAANMGTEAARTAASITWNSGFANVETLKFEARSSDRDVMYNSREKNRINLFDPFNQAGSLLVPSGDYNTVKFKIGFAPTATEPALELVGDYNGTPVVLQINDPFEIKSSQRNVTITDDNGYTAITDFDLSRILRDVPGSWLDNARRTNGQIIISSTQNTNIYNRLVKNVRDQDNDSRWQHGGGGRGNDDDDDDDDD